MRPYDAGVGLVNSKIVPPPRRDGFCSLPRCERECSAHLVRGAIAQLAIGHPAYQSSSKYSFPSSSYQQRVGFLPPLLHDIQLPAKTSSPNATTR